MLTAPLTVSFPNGCARAHDDASIAVSCGAQSLKIFWSEASLGLRRGVVVGKIGMATSHLAVER
jgi:hypothetical protein